ITASGTTLLGADDKAGIAEIMEAARILIENPHIEHGTVKILFTPDEEIGRGVDYVNLERLGADFAYTMDGEKAGTIEDEDRKSTRLNSSHVKTSYAVCCLKKKKNTRDI